MAKISMMQVYKKIQDLHYEELTIEHSEGHSLFRYSFDQFAEDMRKDDLITTDATIKNKWKAAISDEVIYQFGDKKFNKGGVHIENLARKTHTLLPEKRVCVCVSSNKNDTESNTKVRA